jgi:hypothetical protein
MSGILPAKLAIVKAILNHKFARGTERGTEPAQAHPKGSFTATLKAGVKKPKQHPPKMEEISANRGEKLSFLTCKKLFTITSFGSSTHRSPSMELDEDIIDSLLSRDP